MQICIGFGEREKERLLADYACPFMLRDICIIHPVRPLACRGHASFDAEGCRAAARGEDVEIPVSETHLMLRGLVQNALQAALRDAGLPWGLYELNDALAKVLTGQMKPRAWAQGDATLGPAVPDLDMDALARLFDQIGPSEV